MKKKSTGPCILYIEQTRGTMLNKIKAFQKDAERLGTDKNSIEQLKLWLSAEAEDSFINEFAKRVVDAVGEVNGEGENVVYKGQLNYYMTDVWDEVYKAIEQQGFAVEED